MSVAAWRKLLKLTNAAAILGMIAVAHGATGNDPDWRAPVFAQAAVKIGPGSSRIDCLGMPLGAPVRPTQADTATSSRPASRGPHPHISDRGAITAAVAVVAPSRRVQPTITFRYNDGTEIVVRRGETLAGGRFRFVACVADPNEPGLYHFVFRVEGADSSWQSLRWRRGPSGPDPQLVEAVSDGFVPTSSIRIVGDEATIPAPPRLDEIEQKGAEGASTVSVPGNEAPQSKNSPLEGSWCKKDETRWTLTGEARKQTTLHWKKWVGEVRFSEYHSTKKQGGGGVRLRKIPENSPVRRFGFREQDVLVSINGHRVKDRGSVFFVLRREIRAGQTSLRVVLLRAGQEITRTCDISDPDARKEARR